MRLITLLTLFLPFACFAAIQPLPDDAWWFSVPAWLYALSHVRANLPYSIVKRIPGWLNWIIDVGSANYNQAKNETRG